MENETNCDDHPHNMAVETCKSCQRKICGLHNNSLCEEHEQDQSIIDRFGLVIFFILGSLITFLMIGVIVSILDTVDEINTADEGDVITVDGEAVTVTETISIPEMTTFIGIFVAIVIPVLVIIAVILVRVSRAAEEPNIVQKEANQEDDSNEPSPNTYFYCQQCGQQLTIDIDSCPKCGKSTEEEKRLFDN